MEKLFLVETIQTGVTIILGKLTKDNGTFEYLPTKYGRRSRLRWAARPFKDNKLPLFVLQRIFNAYNKETDKYLKELGLKKYDPWQILIKTMGKSPRDTVKFLNEEQARKLCSKKINKKIVDGIFNTEFRDAIKTAPTYTAFFKNSILSKLGMKQDNWITDSKKKKYFEIGPGRTGHAVVFIRDKDSNRKNSGKTLKRFKDMGEPKEVHHDQI
jgi:hypothetical protein